MNDVTEIKKFDDLAADWWNPSGKMQALHDINPLRLAFIEQRATLAGKKILDVGCGGGILAEGMAKRDAIVTGIDLSSNVLTVARQHAKEQNLAIDYQLIEVEKLAEQQSGHYDIITCLELLEHTSNPASIIQSCTKLCKPDGKLFFSTINRTLKSYLFAVIGAEYVLQLLPKGTHDYDKFIRPAEFTQWARDASLTVKEFRGMSYNPLTHEYRLCDDIAVNYLMYCESSL
jgi:2-polyprenyl-6-hydroxyphenyl methylase/3-demethylubiquinone-9 3-methyltransferase